MEQISKIKKNSTKMVWLTLSAERSEEIYKLIIDMYLKDIYEHIKAGEYESAHELALGLERTINELVEND